MWIVATDDWTVMMLVAGTWAQTGQRIYFSDQQRGGDPTERGDVCTRGGSLTSWTEACWKRGIRGLVLGMSMWICREKERKKTDTEATGRLARITAIWRGTVWGQQLVGRLLDWRETGRGELLWNGWQKWSWICLCVPTSLRLSQCLLDHSDAISERLSKRDRWADSSEGRPDGRSSAAGAEPAENRPSVITVPSAPSTYLCYLWLQHQRLRSHPRNIYVDLTATPEKKALNTHTFTLNIGVPSCTL